MTYHPYIQPEFHEDGAPRCATCGERPQHPDHNPTPQGLTRVATSPHKEDARDNTPEGEDNERKTDR